MLHCRLSSASGWLPSPMRGHRLAPPLRGPLWCRRGPERAAAAAESSVAAEAELLSVTLPAADVMRTLVLEVVPVKLGQAIVVGQVASGSAAEQLRVRAGQKLVAISDPVSSKMWPLEDRPSLTFIRQTLQMRQRGEIDLEFAAGPAATAAAAAAAESSNSPGEAGEASATNAAATAPAAGTPSTEVDSSNGTSSSSSLPSLLQTLSSVDEGDAAPPTTIGERLAKRYSQSGNGGDVLPAVSGVGDLGAKPKSDVQQRIERRQEYMDQVYERNDAPFLAAVGAAFLLPALLILAVAYGSGYLDSMYMTSLQAAGH